MVKGETLCCVARHEEISTRVLDSSRHTTVFIIFLVFVWVSAIKADLLCLCLYVLPLQWWSKRGICSKIQCVCSAQREPFFKVMPSSSRSYLEKKQTKNMQRGHTVQYTSKTTCARYTRKKSVLVDENWLQSYWRSVVIKKNKTGNTHWFQLVSLRMQISIFRFQAIDDQTRNMEIIKMKHIWQRVDKDNKERWEII